MEGVDEFLFCDKIKKSWQLLGVCAGMGSREIAYYTGWFKTSIKYVVPHVT